MFKRAWITFLAKVSVSDYLAKSMADMFIRLDTQAKEIDRQTAQIIALHEECKEWAVDYVDLRDKLQKMHRRAQRSEASVQRKVTEVYNQQSEVHRITQANAMNLEIKLARAERFLTVIYPFLHLAWLHSVGSDSKRANDIAAVEARLRECYDGIEIPPKPERFSNG